MIIHEKILRKTEINVIIHEKKTSQNVFGVFPAVPVGYDGVDWVRCPRRCRRRYVSQYYY